MMRFSILFFLLIASLRAELIPAARLGNWVVGTTVGVPGGIPAQSARGTPGGFTTIDVTQSPYNADNTGVTDASAAIQSAANAAVAGDVIYLPAGTYKFSSGGVIIKAGQNAANITLRGAGQDQTIIKLPTFYGLSVGLSASFGEVAVVGGATAGATTLDFASGDTSGISVNQIIQVWFSNESTTPVFSVTGFDLENGNPIRKQHVKVTNVTATQLTFTPALYFTSSEARIDKPLMTSGVGIEDLTVEGTTTDSPDNVISMAFATGCWLKNVRAKGANNYHISITGVNQSEIRRSKADTFIAESASNQAGILINSSTGLLIEDNSVADNFPLMEVNAGTTGIVVGYNYFLRPTSSIGILSNHGPHNAFNLYEGNVVESVIMSDGYTGSESQRTTFRNYLPSSGIENKRFSRYFNDVGNVLGGTIANGLPNIGNGYSLGTASLSGADPWNVWELTATLTTRTSDQVGTWTLTGGKTFDNVPGNGQAGARPQVAFRWSPYGASQITQGDIAADQYGTHTVVFTRTSGAVLPAESTVARFFGGQSEYQELDSDVAGTLIKKGNRYTSDNSFDSLGGDPLPDSLYTTQAAAEARGMDFTGTPGIPAFDPVTPTTPQVFHIPAGLRESSTITTYAPGRLRILRR